MVVREWGNGIRCGNAPLSLIQTVLILIDSILHQPKSFFPPSSRLGSTRRRRVSSEVGKSPRRKTTMNSNPAKRRKLGHSSRLPGSKTRNSTLQLAFSDGTSRPDSFFLEAEELLRENRLDHNTAYPQAREILERLKGAVEKIQPHEAIPVSHTGSQDRMAEPL